MSQVNDEIIKKLKDHKIKASEMTSNDETYVVGELREQRFSVKHIDGEYRLYSGFSARTMVDASTHLTDVPVMVKCWVV